MGTNIITGYTGTRHITPEMDASVFRNIFGTSTVVLPDGDQCAGSMPNINSFTIAGGSVSFQGYQVIVTQETLAVDTCATGYQRIDLVALRYNHNTATQIDSFTLEVIKGSETTGAPTEPAYNTGVISDGANQVDYILFKINLVGATVTFTDERTVLAGNFAAIPSPYTSNPAMSGTASAGVSTTYSRGDHVHPSDTSRVPTTRTVNGKALSSNITLNPTDVGFVTKNATIQVGNWSGTTATISVTGVTASNNVVVSPAPTSMDNYGLFGVRCVSQGAGTLTFGADNQPNVAITVNLIIF